MPGTGRRRRCSFLRWCPHACDTLVSVGTVTRRSAAPYACVQCPIRVYGVYRIRRCDQSGRSMHAGGCAAPPLLRSLLIARCVVIASEPSRSGHRRQSTERGKGGTVLGCFRTSELKTKPCCVDCGVLSFSARNLTSLGLGCDLESKISQSSIGPV